MIKKNSILIIGAGVNQLPIISVAKQLGYHVIAVSPKGNYPGLIIADEVLNEDIFNKEEILKFAKSRPDIGGVLSDQSDIAVPIVAYLAENLGLPGIGYNNSFYFTDKAKMRELLVELNLPIAENYTVTTIEEVKEKISIIGFPVVLKPTDAFASRGVIKIDDFDTLEEKYHFAKSASRSGLLVVEKYIQGPQYFSQGFVEDYKLNLFAFSDRYYFDLPDMFLPYTNAFPALIDESLKNRMKNYMDRIVERLRPQFGHFWAEWIYDDKNDVLYPIEFAARGAGACVTTDVITNAYSIDTQPYLVKAAMGEKTDFDKVIPQNHAAAFYCFLLNEGEIVSIDGLDELSKIKGVVKTNLPQLKIGDIIPPIKDKSSRFGPIVIKGETRAELDKIRSVMMQTLLVKVKTKKGTIEGAIWE